MHVNIFKKVTTEYLIYFDITGEWLWLMKSLHENKHGIIHYIYVYFKLLCYSVCLILKKYVSYLQ